MKSGVCFDESIRRQTAGFTLIEIVLVLVLLGILGTVAANKYFDLRDEAAEKKCAYHRSLVIDALQNRWALVVADSDRRSELFPLAEQAASQVLTELNGEACGDRVPCYKLCPAGGKYTVRAYENCNSSGTHEFEDGYVFSVTCSEHPGEVVSEPEGCRRITTTNAVDLMEFMKKIYQKPLEGNEGADVSTIDEYFTKANKDEVIHSELKGKYNNWNYGSAYDSMTAIINEALRQAEIDTEAVIWSLARTLGDYGDAAHSYWVSELTLVVADKKQAQAAGAGGIVPAQVVVLRVSYKPYSSGEDKKVDKFELIDKSENARAKVSKESDQDGNTYFAVRLLE